MDSNPDNSTATSSNSNGLRKCSDTLVSVIVVVFRECQELRLLLESVMARKTENTEIIVIDGGSDDGTADLLRDFGPAIDYWLSEPDEGLYDAMNKGIAAARGRYIYHINAGDRLLYLPMNELLDADKDGIDIVSFAVSINGQECFFPAVGWRLLINNSLHHQGTFYRRSKFPGYDLKYKIFADFDANQRLVRERARVRLCNTVVASHAKGGISHRKEATKELYRVVASNSGRAYVPLTWLDGKWKGLKRRLVKYAIHS